MPWCRLCVIPQGPWLRYQLLARSWTLRLAQQKALRLFCDYAAAVGLAVAAGQRQGVSGRSRGETRPTSDGHERTWKPEIGAADQLGTSASSEVHTGGPDFHTEIYPPNHKREARI